MQWLIARGVQTFVEVGPGKVLCGLMRQIDRSKKCVNVEDEASLQKTLEFFAASAWRPESYSVSQPHQFPQSISLGGKCKVLSDFSTQILACWVRSLIVT